MKDDVRSRMGKQHETDVAGWIIGGRKTRGSGNQGNDPLDGRAPYYDEFCWAWDCKSTLAKSISITRETLQKLEDQAHGGRPLLPIRFYDNERLTTKHDFVLMNMHDFLDLNDSLVMAERNVLRLEDEITKLKKPPVT